MSARRGGGASRLKQISCTSRRKACIRIPVKHAKSALTRAGVVGCLLACGALSSTALAQKVEIQYDHEADLSQVRRYQWRTHPVFEKNPELQQLYATAIQLVLEAGNQQLMKRGLQPDDLSPDIFVTFFILTREAQEIKTTVLSGWGSAYSWYGAPTWTISEVEDYLRGMVVIDILDAHTSKLLWRAACGDKIKDMRNRDKNINSIVKKALERFPPK